MQELTYKKLNTIMSKVEYCLEKFEDSRNSDIELFARVAENFYPGFERPLYNYRDLAYALHQLPNLDHIARMRRMVIQKHGYKKYLPTDKNIAVFRGISEVIWQDFARANGIKEPVSIASNVPEGFVEP